MGITMTCFLLLLNLSQAFGRSPAPAVQGQTQLKNTKEIVDTERPKKFLLGIDPAFLAVMLVDEIDLPVFTSYRTKGAVRGEAEIFLTQTLSLGLQVAYRGVEEAHFSLTNSPTDVTLSLIHI